MKETMAYFRPASPEVNFAKLDGAVLNFWEENNTFERSVERRPVDNSYVFYDGPPFATGLPHYGHIMTSIIKDVVPRFFTMKGKRVERRFGWDCHGVPVEFEMEKEIGLNGRADILEMGIGNFNEACRGIVLRYTREWQEVITRIGRWVDFEHDYKTMNPDYMETVWWVFKSLYDKGLIYEDYKVVHYSWRLSTPYSNFEATLDDAYRMRQDPSVVVMFKLDGEDTQVLAWTTTPWTLPSNMALAVSPEITYAKIKNGDGNTYVMAKSLLDQHFKEGEYETLAEFSGSELVGKTYQPLLPYFDDKKGEGAFRILSADFVSDEDGTGIVHIAPAYGEDDFFLSRANGVPMVNPVNDTGDFDTTVPDFAGMNVFDANRPIIQKLKAEGLLHSQRTIDHSYPHDWRTDTPLIYRAIPSWYVNVTKFKQDMLAANQQINWYPTHVKNGAFGNWLEGARDWAISRNRFWGAPIPVWRCTADDCNAEVVVGSVDELKALSGIEELADLHSHFVDNITFPCPDCGAEMRRIPEVLDCWFESGSMPYGQIHYPFENKDWFQDNFPADFIVEYIGQTRGWFYTLVVLSAALFNCPPFKNAIAHGILLGEDGRKMSKRLRNYPDVDETIAKYGADALRLYLMGHPVIDGNDSSIEGAGISEMLRRFVIPVWNAFSFLTRYAEIDQWQPATGFADAPDVTEPAFSDLDRWIRSRTYALTYEVDEALSNYRLREAVGRLLDFIDDLNNWYIRRSRDRFWQADKDGDKLAAYQTLHEVMVLLCQVASPLAPFFTELMYKNLTGDESVHLTDWPTPDKSVIDEELNAKMAEVRQIASLGLAARAKVNIKVRQPLSKVTVRNNHALSPVDIELIKDELNVKAVELRDDVSEYTEAIAKPNARVIGPQYGKETPQIMKAVKSNNFEALPDGRYKVAGNDAWVLEADVINVHFEGKDGFACETLRDLVVVLDVHVTPELEREGLARDLVRQVQTLRKEADYKLDDRITVGFLTGDETLQAIINEFGAYIRSETLAKSLLTDSTDGWDLTKQVTVGDVTLDIGVKR
ncbi:MAG: isoleucine--tRNA ligase [Anaerolineaceae bacterium]|nr:isoleucine--tRNA ligase [Anaerolineaceae bacterium]MCB9099893.1 isoleucine--tRNA ligase [Anaerolineales bacterium]